MLQRTVIIRKMTTDELRAYYRELAVLHAECNENGDYKTGNKAYRTKDRVFLEIRKRGSVREFFTALFEDESDSVRCSAAADAWPFFPEISEGVLTEIARVNRGLTGLAAEMVLKGRKSGELWYDFERNPDTKT